MPQRTASAAAVTLAQRTDALAHAPSAALSHIAQLWHAAGRWGVQSLADRAMHDLYTNVRSLISALPRLRLFAAFCGCPVATGQQHLAADADLKDDGTCFTGGYIVDTV